MSSVILLRRISKIPQFPVKVVSVRHIGLQEHAAYAILNKHNIKTPRFGVAGSSDEAHKIARDLLTQNYIVKAQVIADGRERGQFPSLWGGIHAAINPDEVAEITRKMIGQKFEINRDEKVCNSVLVGERKFPRRKFYFAITLDPSTNGPLLVASRSGGMKIEDIDPNLIIRQRIDLCEGLTRETATRIAQQVGICDQPSATAKMLCHLYQLFNCKDLVNAEISSWIEDVCLNYYASDVKLEFDKNAKFRQSEIFNQFDFSQADVRELEAEKLGMSFVPLDGTIGCLANGAGLAMASNDILKIHGGKASNFLDIGSSPTSENVQKAIKILLKDKKTKVIFVTIFAGMSKCDNVIQGLIEAMKCGECRVPFVVCFKGSNQDKAIELIEKTKPNLIVRKELDQAAQMAVRCEEIIKIARGGDLDALLKMKETLTGGTNLSGSNSQKSKQSDIKMILSPKTKTETSINTPKDINAHKK